jgi:hypothetical protein
MINDDTTERCFHSPLMFDVAILSVARYRFLVEIVVFLMRGASQVLQVMVSSATAAATDMRRDALSAAGWKHLSGDTGRTSPQSGHYCIALITHSVQDILLSFL